MGGWHWTSSPHSNRLWFERGSKNYGKETKKPNWVVVESSRLFYLFVFWGGTSLMNSSTLLILENIFKIKQNNWYSFFIVLVYGIFTYLPRICIRVGSEFPVCVEEVYIHPVWRTRTVYEVFSEIRPKRVPLLNINLKEGSEVKTLSLFRDGKVHNLIFVQNRGKSRSLSWVPSMEEKGGSGNLTKTIEGYV